MEYNRPGVFTHEGDREASPPERGNGSLPWSGPQINFLEQAPERNVSGEPSTQEGIETVVPCASLLRTHLSITAVSLVFLRP
jgi:hypothetical protein